MDLSPASLYEVKEFSVSELSAKIKSTIEISFNFIKVRGEISGLKLASSGHCYFNLKDANAVIAVTVWRPVMSNLSVRLEDGLEILISGRVTTYPNMSRYQINALKIELSGIGSLMQLLEKRKKQLTQEGLFDKERKKSLPLLPQKIGVVTSLKGAVIRDIIHRISDRCPVHVLIWPVLVQGEKAANEIANAIDGFNENASIKPDLIIVARGGGSIEDLWAFNEEIVVRSTANSNIPIISAVGHETDVTLIDFASDKRAPTPTAASEFAVPVVTEIKESLDSNLQKLRYRVQTYIQSQSNLVAAYTNHHAQFPEKIMAYSQILDDSQLLFKRILPLVIERKQSLLAQYDFSPALLRKMIEIKYSNLENYWQKLLNTILGLLDQYQNMLETLKSKISFLDYRKILDQGFGVLRTQGGKVISSKLSVIPEEEIVIELRDGKIYAITK